MILLEGQIHVESDLFHGRLSYEPCLAYFLLQSGADCGYIFFDLLVELRKFNARLLD